MRFLSLDHAYEDAWNALPHSTPEEWFRQCFGTADFLDVALRCAGHEATTHFTNGDPHYQLAIASYNPDVIISTAASRWGAYPGSPLAEIRKFNSKIKLVLFCSHKVDDYVLQGWDVIFSSFRWMPEHCRALGVRCEYLPLSFGKPVLDRIGEMPKERDIPVAFFGGLGSRIWDKGTATMAHIAGAVPEFRWWGYWVGPEEMPSALRQSHRGALYGLSCFGTMLKTKIIINRHGEIARGYGNNMRQWESLGCGCRLLTDNAGEIPFCIEYGNAEDACQKIRSILDDWIVESEAAKEGQRWVLQNGCYENRIPNILSVVEGA